MVAGDRPENALKHLGPYVVHTHAKDGIKLRKPAEGEIIVGEEAQHHAELAKMGHAYIELPLGKGGVDFDVYLPALKAAGFDGFLTIEREVGENPEADIAMAVDFLREKIARHSL
jgi:sugar phosphate isomerase/epimerase